MAKGWWYPFALGRLHFREDSISGSTSSLRQYLGLLILILVDMVVMIREDLLTQWRHIPMGQFHTNIFLIPFTSNYLCASEVFKNQILKVNYFHLPTEKIIPSWNHGLIFMLLLFFIYKIKNLRQFSEKKSPKMGFKSSSLMHRSIFTLKYYQNIFIL